MKPSSKVVKVSRCRPLMGTFVEIHVWHDDEALANKAIESAFDAIQTVERAMSFHDSSSLLSQLNREAFSHPVTVSESLYEVLEFAQSLYLETNGLFDLSIGSELIHLGELPEHPLAQNGSGGGQDIRLLPHNQVSFLSPLQIDLGGIAKGFSVDQAIKTLQAFSLESGLVNAGGDLRYFGTQEPRISLRHPGFLEEKITFSDLKKQALATSTPSKKSDTFSGSLHINGQTREPLLKAITVSVFADTCMVADALTKIVSQLQDQSSDLLDKFNALAFVTQENI